MLDFFSFVRAISHTGIFLSFPLIEENAMMMREFCLASPDYFCIMKPFQWSPGLQYALDSEKIIGVFLEVPFSLERSQNWS